MEKDVFLAIPSYSGKPNYQCIRAADACVLRKDNPAKVIQLYVGDSLVTRCRNELVRLFLKSDCKYLLFIDDDLEFDPQHITRLRSHALPIVGGLYFKKNLLHAPVLNRPGQAFDNGLMEVGEVGTGFLMIRRDVFGAMKEWFDIEYAGADDQDKGSRWDFFPVGRKGDKPTDQYLSEDYFFCQRATDLGYKVYVDQQTMIQHHGQASFPPTQDALTLGLTESLRIVNAEPMKEAVVDELANQLEAYRKRHYDVASKIEILKPLQDVPVKG
jgi:hypothetical protein